MGGGHYFVLTQGGGQIFVIFYHEKAPMFVYIYITNYNRISHANTPAQYKLNYIKRG